MHVVKLSRRCSTLDTQSAGPPRAAWWWQMTTCWRARATHHDGATARRSTPDRQAEGRMCSLPHYRHTLTLLPKLLPYLSLPTLCVHLRCRKRKRCSQGHS